MNCMQCACYAKSSTEIYCHSYRKEVLFEITHMTFQFAYMVESPVLVGGCKVDRRQIHPITLLSTDPLVQDTAVLKKTRVCEIHKRK